VEEVLQKLRSSAADECAIGEAEAEALRAILSARAGSNADFTSADGAVAADGDGLRSSALRGATEAIVELRSYVQGLRSEVELLRDRASDKARRDLELTLAAADYLARRVIIDSGALLSAAGAVASSSLRLGSAPPPPARETAAPFAARADKVEQTLAASVAHLGKARSGGLTPAAEARSFLSGEDAEAEAEAADRQRERAHTIASEGAQLAREGWSVAEQQVRGWLREAGLWDGGGATPAPSAEAVQARSRMLGSLCASAVSDAAVAAARATRADAAAYAALRQTGRLPTLLEEAAALAPVLPRVWVDGLTALPPQVLDAVPLRALVGGGRLGAFDLQESPTAQLASRVRRRDREAAWRQLALAGAVAGRASKDSSDLLVVGVLPAVRAAGRVAVGRVAGGDSGGSLMRELASSLRQEFASTAEQMRVGSSLGAAVGEAVQQTTRRISRSVASATAMLPGAPALGARGGLAGSRLAMWGAADVSESFAAESNSQWGFTGVGVVPASGGRVSALRASAAVPVGEGFRHGPASLLEWPVPSSVAPVPRAPETDRPWAATRVVDTPASESVGDADVLDVLDVSAVVEEGEPDRMLALLDASLFAAEVLMARMAAVVGVAAAEARGEAEREWMLLPTAFGTAKRVRVRREQEASRRLLDALTAAVWRV
jgi:hypothetical protein